MRRRVEAADYKVKLEIFEGPLDLLLYLIKKDEIDIFDIPLARVIEQYQLFLSIMRDLDPNACGEFLVMAANLMEIKSKLLLPREELEEEEALADEDALAFEDMDDEEAVLMTVEGVAKRGRGRSTRSGKRRDQSSDVVWVEPDTIDLFTEEPDAPEVTATALSIVVPNLGGETVRYQKLLLDAGETPVVLVRARNQTPSK